MTHLNFVTLDVFTSTPYSGNPLAVVFLPEDPTSALTQPQKQIIAREFNCSETIFVHPVNDKTKRTIDIFTTDHELPFAGHPTIGAASWFLHHSTNPADSSHVTTLTTKSGDIPITANSLNKTVAAKIAHNTRIHAARFSKSELLRLHPSLAPFIPVEDVTFPVFSIVNGMSQLFIELPSLEALAAVAPASGGELVSDEYLDEGWKGGLICVYFFVRGVEDSALKQKVIRSRMMLGTLEDPATGSAASGLAAYLALTEGKAGETVDYHVVQGVEMGRRSDIGVKVTLDGERAVHEVVLTGTAVSVSEGKVLVPRV
jgi:PhzF family phenazine biosynthesis protein